jgi:hypothetical protein
LQKHFAGEACKQTSRCCHECVETSSSVASTDRGIGSPAVA